MTANEKKKKREVAFFEMVRKMRPEIWPVSDVENHDHERPDVLVSAGPMSYGVEVTELVEEPTRAAEERRRKVCVRAHRLAKLPSGLEVAVLFQPHVALGKPHQREAAASLIAELARTHAEANGPVDWHVRVDLWDTPLWSIASTIFLHYIHGWEHGRWYAAEAWPVGPLQPGRIRQTIASKEGNLNAYLVHAPRIYLLIVAEGFRGSTAVHVPDLTLEAEYVTGFDGVVLLDYGNNQVHLLRTRQPRTA